MREYVGAATVAGWFGVSRSTVAKWRERYDCPAPSVTIDGVPGWPQSSEAAWRRWHARRPGQGAGGGRPRSVSGAPVDVAPPADEEFAEDVRQAVSARQRATATARRQRQTGSGAG
ncbi:hypothetical protein [Actinophytocola sediminis]